MKILAAATSALTLLALLLIVLPGINGPLIHDSTKLYALEQHVSQYGDNAVWHTPAFEGGLFGRIVPMATFVLNVQATDQVAPKALKTTNIVIHVVGGLLIFFLTKLLLGQTPQRQHALMAAVGVMALWLLAPLTVSSALYAIQRMNQLAALFVLAGLLVYAYLRAYRHGPVRLVLLGLGCAACFLLGLASKENAVLLPLFVILTEFYFFGFRNLLLTPRQWQIGLALILVVTPLALVYSLPNFLNYALRDFTLAERLLTQPRVLLLYLQQIILPLNNDTGIYYDDFLVSTSLVSPPTTLLAIIALVGMLLLIGLLYRWGYELVSYGLAFFLVGHVLESSVLPLEMVYLHRNYLPAYGIYLAIIAGFLHLYSRLSRPLLIYGIAGIYLAFFCAVSYSKSLTWSSLERIYATAAQYHPDSPRALTNLATLLFTSGRPELAIAVLDDKIKRLPGDGLLSQIQKLYIQCYTQQPIQEAQYVDLVTAQGFSTIEISQALSNLFDVYQNTRCKTLNVSQLVEALGKLADQHRDRLGDAWHIDYYIVLFLDAVDESAAASQRLTSLFDKGHIPSGFFLLERYISLKQKDEAHTLMQYIEGKIVDKKNAAFSEWLEEYKILKIEFNKL